MNKYLIPYLLFISFMIFSNYYLYVSSQQDICNYIYCFEHIKPQELITIYLSILNIGIIIYGLNSWKDQTNINRKNQIYKDLLDILDDIETSRSNYEMTFYTVNQQVQLSYDPKITLTFYESIKDNLNKNRYLDINRIAKYNSKIIYFHHYFPNFDYDSFNDAYVEYLNCLDTMCDYHFKDDQISSTYYYEKFSNADKNYKLELNKLRVLIFNAAIIK